jgi:hypothetical protein
VLHLFNKKITISISSDGVSTKINGKVVQLLSGLESNFFLTRNRFKELEMVTEKIKANKVRFVLSNRYCKFISLPWNAEIYSEKDWLSIAKREFSDKLGIDIKTYQLSICWKSYGQSVLVCALEKTIIDFLENIAKINKWKIEAIQPFASAVFSKKKRSYSSEWLAIAEPEYVLLIKLSNNQVKKFITILPEFGKEKQQTLLCIKREEKFLDKKSFNSDKLIAIVAPKIKRFWTEELKDEESQSKTQQDTSTWMTHF